MRRGITIAMIAVGLALMVLGYFLSAPWGVEGVVNSDPRLPFAPALFVLGVISVFASAVVYEVRSDRRR